MKQVYIQFAMRLMHWREKAAVFCGFTLLPSGMASNNMYGNGLILYIIDRLWKTGLFLKSQRKNMAV